MTKKKKIEKIKKEKIVCVLRNLSLFYHIVILLCGS